MSSGFGVPAVFDSSCVARVWFVQWGLRDRFSGVRLASPCEVEGPMREKEYGKACIIVNVEWLRWTAICCVTMSGCLMIDYPHCESQT